MFQRDGFYIQYEIFLWNKKKDKEIRSATDKEWRMLERHFYNKPNTDTIQIIIYMLSCFLLHEMKFHSETFSDYYFGFKLYKTTCLVTEQKSHDASHQLQDQTHCQTIQKLRQNTEREQSDTFLINNRISFELFKGNYH